jgi:hypothetical protein
MGVEYELVDMKYRRAFELGKWMFLRRFVERKPGERLTPETVLADVVEAKRGTFHGPTEQEAELYWRSVAVRIWAFCESADWEVMLVGERDYPSGMEPDLVMSLFPPTAEFPLAEDSRADSFEMAVRLCRLT